jgi:hypothetical protein
LAPDRGKLRRDKGRVPVTASRTRRPLQPEASSYELTKELEPSECVYPI